MQELIINLNLLYILFLADSPAPVPYIIMQYVSIRHQILSKYPDGD